MMFASTLNEQTIARYTTTLKDEAGVAIPSGSLSALELWVYDVRTNTVINGRGVLGGAGQNVLNTNNVTVDSNGLLTWTIQGADNRIVDDGRATEAHRAVFRATWGGGKTALHQIQLNVVNLKPVV